MKMSRRQLWLLLWLALAGALLAGAAGERRGREKRTLDLLLRGLAQALGYEVRPIKGRGVIPATEPPPRSAGAGGAPSGAQKERESTTPSVPEPVTDPRRRPPYDVDDLLSYRGQQQQGGASPGPGAAPASTPAPPPPPTTPPPDNSAITQFVRANAGSLLNAEFDRTQLGRGPGGIKCRDELALPDYPGYGPDFDSGPHLEFQKGEGQQHKPDHSTQTDRPQDPHQPSHPPGEQQHWPLSETPGLHKVPTIGGQVEDEVPQLPSYNSADGPGKQSQENFADVLFGPLIPEQKQPGRAEEAQNGPPESAHSESTGNGHGEKRPGSGGPDGGYVGVVLGAPIQYGPLPGDDQSFSKQHRHQAEHEQEEVNREGAYVGVIVQAPLRLPDHQQQQPAAPPRQVHGTQQEHQVHHRGPNSEQLFHQWASATPSAQPSLQPYIFSYTVPAWVSSRRSDEEAAEAPAHSHLSLLEEPHHATGGRGGGYFPHRGGEFERPAQFREEDLPEPLRLHRAEEQEEEEEEEEVEEEEEQQQQQEEDEQEQQQDYDEEAAQQEETPPPPPPPRSTPPTPAAPRSSAAAPGGSAPPPAAGSLVQQLPLPLTPASTHAPPMLQLLQQRQQPPPRAAGGGEGGAPGAGVGLGVGVGALWPPPPFDSAASAQQASSNDLLASTEKRAAEAGTRNHTPPLWAARQLATSPALSAARAPSAQFPVHYNPEYASGGPSLVLLQTAVPGRALPATAASAAPTPALDADLPWTFYTDPANHRHNFAFSTAEQQQDSTRGAAAAPVPVLSTPATWALLSVSGNTSPTKVYKRHAAAARSWAFHSEREDVFLVAGDDDDSDGCDSQPPAVRRAAPMTHSESFGSLWRDFVARLSEDDDVDGEDSEAAGSEGEGAVARSPRSGGWHLPTYHRDPLGYVSKYVPEDEDDAGFVGASSVLRTRVAEGRAEKREEAKPSPDEPPSTVEAVTWPSYNDPVLYGEDLEKQQQSAGGQSAEERGEARQPGAGDGTHQEYAGTQPSSGGVGTLQTPPDQTGQGRGREDSGEVQPTNSAGGPNDESAKEAQAAGEAGKSEEQREEFVPYFARPEHYRIRAHEEEEGEESRFPQPEAADMEQGGSQRSGVAAQRRKKPWYFKEPGPRYGGSRGREQQAQRQPETGAQNRRAPPPHHQQQAQPDVWEYYGNPDNFYVPPDTLSTIVIGEVGGEEQGEASEEPTKPPAKKAPARRRPAAGRSSRESDWPPAGFRSGTHHSGGPSQRQREPAVEASTEHWSPHFTHHNPYHREYQYPEVEYTPLTASTATAERSEDTFPWSLYEGSPSHFFTSHKKKVPENATRTETPSKATAGSSGKEKGKEAAKPATSGPDPLWQLAMRALAHAAAAGRAKGPAAASGEQAATTAGGASQQTSAAPHTPHSWFSAGGRPPPQETATTISAGDSKREGISTVGEGGGHWTPYSSPFSQKADTGGEAGSGASPWPPESFFQEPAALGYERADGRGAPSHQQQQAGPTAPPRQEARTTTTSSSTSTSSAAALLGLLLPRLLLPPPSSAPATAAAPTAQEVLQNVRPQVRISVSPAEGGGVATVAAVEPVRYEFSTQTTLLAPLSGRGLSRETVSRASSLHLTGHFQVNPDDKGDADAVARPQSRIATVAAI